MSDPGSLQRLKDANDDAKAGAKPQVLGLKAVSGVKARLDIDVMIRDEPDVFNLFILAFAELKNSSGDMGFFEIAGIHGLPKRAWNGVGGKQNIPNQVPSGYCTHSIELFPVWHRAYLAMLEQTVFLKMLEIAGRWKLPEHQKKYTEAAYSFRLPYWDHFRPRGGSVTFDGVIDKNKTTYPYDFRAPLILTSENIMARTYPDDNLERLSDANTRFGKNPFFDFKFPTGKGEIATEDWNKVGSELPENLFPRTRTVRYPRHDGEPSSTASLNRVLNNMRMDSNRLALAMITEDIYANYETFSCNSKDPKAPKVTMPLPNDTGNAKWVYTSGSLEDIHNKYHVLIGGNAGYAGGAGGHLSRVPCAAFDPAFWFHHGNIERIFSIWQAVNAKKTPKNWFKDNNLAGADLLPFRKDANTFWNSNELRTTDVLGYNYPETAGAPQPEDVLKRVTDMYYWSVPDNDVGQNGPIPDSMIPIKVEDSIFFKGANEPLIESALVAEKPSARTVSSQHVALPIGLTTEEYARDWYIDDEVQRLALNGAFTIFYFVGSNGEGPAQGANLLFQGTLVGLNHVFAAPVEICDNCGVQEQRSEIVSSTSAITSELLDYVKIGELASLEPKDVVPFLKKNLKWRIVTVNGDIIDPRSLAEKKDLKIKVSAKKVRLPRIAGDVEYEEYPEVVEAILAHASATMDTAA